MSGLKQLADELRKKLLDIEDHRNLLRYYDFTGPVFHYETGIPRFLLVMEYCKGIGYFAITVISVVIVNPE